MSLISDPLFTANNTEELEALDVYDVTDTRPINKLWDATVNKSEEMFERVGGIKGILEGVDRIQTSKQQGATGRQMVDQVLEMFGSSSGSILRQVGDSVLDKAGKFLDLDPSTLNQVKTAASQISHIVDYGDVTDISQYGNIVGLIGDLSGNQELASYINIGYQSAVWASVLVETMEYGDYRYIDYLKNEIDPEVYRQSLIYSIPTVATSGRYEALQAILKTLRPEEIVAEYPEFIPVFLRYFKLPDELPEGTVSYAQQVFDTLANLDATWYIHYQDDERTVYDLAGLTEISDDGKFAFAHHSIIGPLIQMAPHYPADSVQNIIHRDFPMMVTNLL